MGADESSAQEWPGGHEIRTPEDLIAYREWAASQTFSDADNARLAAARTQIQAAPVGSPLRLVPAHVLADIQRPGTAQAQQLSQLGGWLLSNGHPREATPFLKQAVDGGDEEAVALLGSALIQARDIPGAREVYTRHLERLPYLALPLGELELAEGNTAVGRAHFLRFVRHDPEATVGAAAQLLILGDEEGARQIIEEMPDAQDGSTPSKEELWDLVKSLKTTPAPNPMPTPPGSDAGPTTIALTGSMTAFTLGGEPGTGP